MSISATRIDELIAATRRTFGAIPRPVCTKRIAQALDDEWLVSEARGHELSAMDTEVNWWDVSDEELPNFWSILRWLSPEGFRFYYPAFLTYTLRHWNDSHDLVHEETVRAIGNGGVCLDELTLAELKLIEETLVELSCDPKGEKYDWIATLITIEFQLKKALSQTA